MVFDGKFAGGKRLLDAFGLKRGVEEPNSLKSRALSIILCRTSIFSLCLIYANVMSAAMAEVTALEIMNYIAGSIAGRKML